MEKQFQVAGLIHNDIFIYEVIDFPSKEEVFEIYSKGYFLVDFDGSIFKATNFYHFAEDEMKILEKLTV